MRASRVATRPPSSGAVPATLVATVIFLTAEAPLATGSAVQPPVRDHCRDRCSRSEHTAVPMAVLMIGGALLSLFGLLVLARPQTVRPGSPRNPQLEGAASP